MAQAGQKRTLNFTTDMEIQALLNASKYITERNVTVNVSAAKAYWNPASSHLALAYVCESAPSKDDLERQDLR